MTISPEDFERAERERAMAALRAEIMKGWVQAEQGLSVPMSEKWLEQTIAAARRRWAERKARQHEEG